MEQKTARLTVLIDPAKKAAFEHLCAQQDLTASQVVRRLIREYLAHHGVQYVPSGIGVTGPKANNNGGTPSVAPARRAGTPPAKRRSGRHEA